MPRQAGEAALLLDAQAIAGLLRRGIEIIRHGVDFVAAVFLEEIGQPRPAPAATDQAELDLARELRRFCFARGGIGRENERRVKSVADVPAASAPPRKWRREQRAWLVMGVPR